MAFDIHFLCYRNGVLVDDGLDAMLEVVDPYVDPYVSDADNRFLRIDVDGSTAELYFNGGGMMATHIHGKPVLGLLLDVARAADWVVLPQSGPFCILNEEQRANLPDGIEHMTVVVTSVDDLVAAIEAAMAAANQ